jgi:hypothetical protein
VGDCCGLGLWGFGVFGCFDVDLGVLPAGEAGGAARAVWNCFGTTRKAWPGGWALVLEGKWYA